MPAGIEMASFPAAAQLAGAPPLIAHVLYRLDIGGLENGLVNLINRLPEHRYRHTVVCLTDYTDFGARIRRAGVTLHALHKPSGNSLRLQWQLWRLFRELKPSIVHTRNLGTLEAQVPAWLAGVPVRIHGEHGRDVWDLDGTSRKHQRLRRLYRPFVQHYIALSQDLARYLTGPVGIAARRVTQLYNGVDVDRFRPRASADLSLPPFAGQRCFIVGTVGRMQTVKDQTTLVRAFIRALELMPEARSSLRLAMIGDGPLRSGIVTQLALAGVADLAWLPGSRDDVPGLVRGFDLFALPSLAEGISNTILEAMASALPVVATRVGGNPELVVHGRTGSLVPAADVDAMARAILDYYRDPGLARQHGEAGRVRVLEHFSLDAMVTEYDRMYDQCLALAGRRSLASAEG